VKSLDESTNSPTLKKLLALLEPTSLPAAVGLRDPQIDLKRPLGSMNTLEAAE
jgi:hypothetical protein